MIKKPILSLILFAVSFLLYSNTLNGEFLVDDISAIVNNPQIGQIINSSLNPAQFINSLLFLIFGKTPFYYHLASVVLHAINSILVFYFLGLFFGINSAFLGALLFAVNPINTEAVAWISGKGYSVQFLFFLTAYFFYLKATDYPREKDVDRQLKPSFNSDKLYLFFCLVIVIYYLGGTYSGLLLAAFLILSDISFNKKNNLKYSVFFLIVGCIIFILTKKAMIVSRVSFMADYYVYKNPLVYLAYSLYYNFWLLIWPAKLTLFHEPVVIPPSMASLTVLYLLPVAGLIWLAFKKARVLFFALGIFFIFLSPTFSPLPISSLIAERYLYFPSLSLSIAASFIFQRYYPDASRIRRFYILLIAVLVITNYTLRTFNRNKDWNNPQIFWESSARVKPDNYMVQENLGYVYLMQGQIKKARQAFERAIEFSPRPIASYYNNLGAVYYTDGRVVEAIDCYKKALEIDPEHLNAHISLGKIYQNLGKTSSAEGPRLP